MIKESRKYVQGGVIATRVMVCDICGEEIRPKAVGWAYIQETKTPTQARLMSEQKGRDEFEHICLDCWEYLKKDVLRPMANGDKLEFRVAGPGEEPRAKRQEELPVAEATDRSDHDRRRRNRNR